MRNMFSGNSKNFSPRSSYSIAVEKRKPGVESLLAENAGNEKFLRKYVGGEELLQGKTAVCLVN